MTLDEAIKHCEEKAKSNRNEVKRGAWEKDSLTEQRCIRCAEEHEQLAEWLKELKSLREVHGKVYRNEKCDRAGKCYDYIGYHCAGCNGAKEGGTDCIDEDAKQASIPYTYNAPQHDWKCGYPDITRGKGGAK